MKKIMIGTLVAATACSLLAASSVSADGRKQCMDGDRFVVKVLKGKLGCKNARRELRNFMDNVYGSNPPCYPGKCRNESPNGWRCQLENKQLTEEAGRTARCKRKSDGSVAVLTYLGEISTGRAAAASAGEQGGARLLRGNSVSGSNLDSWCSGAGQSNASCTLIRKRRGKIIVAWATSRSSVKRYKFCLRNPRGSTRCVKRPMRETKRDGVWADGFWLNHELKTNRPGEYGASWIANGKRVGPILHFRVK